MQPPSVWRPGRMLLKLACAGLLVGGAAQARLEACDAAQNRSSSACLTRVMSAEVGRAQGLGKTLVADVGAAAGASLVVWQPDRHVEIFRAAEPRPTPDSDLAAAPSNDPSLLGLLLAALGVVGFVAQRRSGR